MSNSTDRFWKLLDDVTRAQELLDAADVDASNYDDCETELREAHSALREWCKHNVAPISTQWD